MCGEISNYSATVKFEEKNFWFTKFDGYEKI